MPAPAADQTRRFAWLAGAMCLLCCLVQVLGIAGVTGLFSAIGFRDVLVAGVAAAGAGVTWWVIRRRRRCTRGGCECRAS